MPSFYHSLAQDTVIQTETPVGVDMNASPSSEIKKERINYEFPFPGMLPDHPLYILKVIRDGIVKRLINDELMLAKFSLSSAEKRMYAGRLLLEKDEHELAIDSISKSANYLSDTLSAVTTYHRKHPKSFEYKPFLQKFKTATEKHIEVMEDIKPSVEKNYLSQFNAEEEKIKRIEKTVKELLTRK